MASENPSSEEDRQACQDNPHDHNGDVPDSEQVGSAAASKQDRGQNQSGQTRIRGSRPPQPQWHDFEILIETVNQDIEPESGLDGPAFFWNRFISDSSEDLAQRLTNSPVAPTDQARTVMTLPMDWYLYEQTHLADMEDKNQESLAGIGSQLGILRMDMPTFDLESQALAGVQAVVANAMASNRWKDALGNLVAAIELTSSFMGRVADRDGQGFEFLKDLIEQLRIYMDALASQADTQLAQESLQLLLTVVCKDDFLLNPVQMMHLLSACLSFAQWDDTRVLAYDALQQAISTMDRVRRERTTGHGDGRQAGGSAEETSKKDPDGHGGPTRFTDPDDPTDPDNPVNHLFEDSDGNLVDIPFDLIGQQFDQVCLFLQHDLLRVGGEEDRADQFLAEHLHLEPMADAWAIRLIGRRDWSGLLSLSEQVTAANPNQEILSLPEEPLPYGWESLKELALVKLGRTEELIDLYRERIIEFYEPNTGKPAVNTSDSNRTRQMEQGTDPVAIYSTSTPLGTIQASGPTNSARELLSRFYWACDDHLLVQIETLMTSYADGQGRFTPNRAYEELLIDQGLSRAAWRYCRRFPESRLRLAPTIARGLPDKARTIILGPIGMDGSYHGRLPDRRIAYQHLSQTLSLYAKVFSFHEAATIARKLTDHFPDRPALAQALRGFLEA
ncbi:hypothetical protein [Bifidobacterium aemilianum]|nr:hypothetical protein [Bifidobacterium aemilianum]